MSTKAPETIELRGQLTSADMRRTEPIFVQMPEGVTNLHVCFRFQPKQAPDQQLPYQISLMIFDPNGPRFEISRPNDQGIFINAAQASPGGTPGPIQPGQWMIFILVHRLLSDDPVHYELDLTLTFDPLDQEPVQWEPGTVAARGPGWYRGDLHAHTIHSDGWWDIPDIVRFWHEMGADFMTLSDHNTISGLPQVRSMADDDLLVLGGMELSTYFGHAVAVDIDRWFDWRRLDGSQITMPELAAQVIESGALFTIAHPMNPGDPGCCGCRWEHEDMRPGNALAVEIWNGGWKASNQEALQLWYRWLNHGHRLTATSGTDLHGPPPEGERGALNVVYAADLSAPAIIAGLKAGRSYLSAGPDLFLTATTASGATGTIGDTLPAQDATVTVRWAKGHQEDGIRFVVDGKVYREKIVGPEGELQWRLPAGMATWCCVELRDRDGDMWAVTNPIFFTDASAA